MDTPKKLQTIAIVDDNVANLTISRSILKGHYETYTLPSAASLFELLESITPDLILLDIEMPQMDGYQTIEKLKSDPRLEKIPVIFLTSREDKRSELKGLSLGAIDYILKPFSPPLLLKRIENHLLISSQRNKLEDYNNNLEKMVAEKTARILKMQERILNIIAEMVEFRDDVTGGHIERTQMYLKLLLDKILEKGVYKDEVAKWDLTFLLPSAQLHDVGKIAISDNILNKPGKLTQEEFKTMKTHAEIGVKAIEKIETDAEEDLFLSHAKCFAGTHHEKWDGSGYPAGLAGEDIPLQGRLMAIADVYDALISSRPYKDPMPLDMAKNIILEGKGKHFDPVLVDIFSEVSDGFEKIALQNRESQEKS